MRKRVKKEIEIWFHGGLYLSQFGDLTHLKRMAQLVLSPSSEIRCRYVGYQLVLPPMFRSHYRTGSARSRGLLPTAGDLGISEERKAPGQQKRPGRPKRYATGDVTRVMHSEVDASHSHQQYDPERHRQNRDLMPGSLKMPAHKNSYGQIERCGRQ